MKQKCLAKRCAAQFKPPANKVESWVNVDDQIYFKMVNQPEMEDGKASKKIGETLADLEAIEVPDIIIIIMT